MSMIPNIRAEYTMPLFPNTKEGKQMIKDKEPNGYYQGLLSDEDAEYLAGYDYAIEQMLASLIYNISDYFDELVEDEIISEESLDLVEELAGDFVDGELDEEGKRLELSEIKDPMARLIFTVFRAVFDWAEMERDELGTSMIESMGEEEYQKCRERLADGYKNAIVRQCENWAKQRAEQSESDAE